VNKEISDKKQINSVCNGTSIAKHGKVADWYNSMDTDVSATAAN